MDTLTELHRVLDELDALASPDDAEGVEHAEWLYARANTLLDRLEGEPAAHDPDSADPVDLARARAADVYAGLSARLELHDLH